MLINTNNMNTYLFIKLAWVVTGQLGRPQSFQPSLARGVITICPAPPWRCWAGAAGRSPGPPPPPPACRWRGAGVRRAGTWGRGPARGPRTPATQPSPPPVKNYYNTVQNDSNNNTVIHDVLSMIVAWPRSSRRGWLRAQAAPPPLRCPPARYPSRRWNGSPAPTPSSPPGPPHPQLGYRPNPAHQPRPPTPAPSEQGNKLTKDLNREPNSVRSDCYIHCFTDC